MTDIILKTAVEFWQVLADMVPYLLFGFIFAGLLSALISAETVERQLGKKGFLSTFKAAIFGIPLPLCSCGVIPVGASLKKNGASKGATTSFLISTPQTGVDSILVTYSLLGPVFAIFRPFAALASGLLGGVLVDKFDDVKDSEANNSVLKKTESINENGSKIIQVIRYPGFIALPQDIGRAMLIGLVIAGLISAVIPDDFFASFLGTGIAAMLVMMALGIPVYVCATASVPIAAALIAKGVSPGAALIFLMTGPATNAAAIATIWKIMGKKTAILYLATVAVTALLSGLLLDYIIGFSTIGTISDMPWMLPDYIKVPSAIFLLFILALAFFHYDPWEEKIDPGTERKGIKYNVEGMSCNNCALNIKKELIKIDGINDVHIDFKNGEAHVEGEHINNDLIINTIEELGYKAKTG